METLRIEILNPKAKDLLKGLVGLDLIRITEEKEQQGFQELLTKLRKNAKTAPSLKEITKEVEAVRRARYEKK